MCSLIGSRGVSIQTDPATQVLVAGKMKIGNASSLGPAAEATFCIEGKTLQFGKSMLSARGQFLAPNATTGLGHSNLLQGQFIGRQSKSDFNTTVEFLPECTP